MRSSDVFPLLASACALAACTSHVASSRDVDAAIGHVEPQDGAVVDPEAAAATCVPDPDAFGWLPSPDANYWVDPATCHKVVRISRLVGRDFNSLYFTQHAFTAQGDKLVFEGQDDSPGNGLWTIDIPDSASLGTGAIRKVVDLGGEYAFPIVAQKTRDVFAVKFSGANGSVHSIVAVDLDTLAERTIYTFPASWDFSPDAALGFAGLALNADEQTIAGAYTAGVAEVVAALGSGASKTDVTNAITNAKLTTELFAIDVHDGTLKTLHTETGWFDHTQFSPTDPDLLMFDHEGYYQPRIWLYDLSSGEPTYFRGYDPVVGDQPTHEFFSNGGTWVWFDDFTSALPDQLLAKRISDGYVTGFSLTGAQRSRHYNISHDSLHFAADGNPPIDGIDPHPGIMLFTPQADGTVESEKLCAIEHNDFTRIEPNVRFTPDDKWVVFSSTAQTGEPQLYAVRTDTGGE